MSKLADMAAQGKVYGIDYSETSVVAAKRKNAHLIATGQVQILQGSVSRLLFPDETFDLVTAVETHFFWPDLSTDLCEVRRVLKPGGELVMIAEAYSGGKTLSGAVAEKVIQATGMTLLTLEEHKELLDRTGFSEVRIIEQSDRGWMCASGRKPLIS